MNLTLERFRHGHDCTVGTLFVGELQLYTLEPPPTRRSLGIIRIPEGSYELKLSDKGFENAVYRRYIGKDRYKGRLLIDGAAPGEEKYLAVGNTARDAVVGPVIGLELRQDMVIRSRDAFQLVYPTIAGAIAEGDGVVLRIVNKL